MTGPGLVKNAPKMLRDPNFPLFLRWRYLPKLVPWLVQYLSHANTDDTRRISQGLTQIVGDSLEQHQALSAGHRLPNGSVKVIIVLPMPIVRPLKRISLRGNCGPRRDLSPI